MRVGVPVLRGAVVVRWGRRRVVVRGRGRVVVVRRRGVVDVLRGVVIGSVVIVRWGCVVTMMMTVRGWRVVVRAVPVRMPVRSGGVVAVSVAVWRRPVMVVGRLAVHVS